MDGRAPEMMEFAWVDRDMRYFVATRGSLEEGQAVSTQIWCQVIADVNSDAHMVDLDISQPVAAYIYHATCSSIDRHN